jgi:hypothetical protein
MSCGLVAAQSPFDLIGPAGLYGGWSNVSLNAMTTGNQPFVLNSSDNRYAFRFRLNGRTHYGWAQIGLGASLSAPRTLFAYGWDDTPDTPIWGILEPWGACCMFGGSCFITEHAVCAQIGGAWTSTSFCQAINCQPTQLPPCAADLNASGAIDMDDLLFVLTHWGPCPTFCTIPCPADLYHNCWVNIGDLLIVIDSWGPCAPP